MRLSKIDLARLLVGAPLFLITGALIIIPVVMLFNTKASKAGLCVVILFLGIIELGLLLLTWAPFKRWNQTGELRLAVRERNLAFASFSQRFFAGCIDCLLFSPLIFLRYLFGHFTITDLVLFKILSVLNYPYLLLMVAWRGQTVGKMVMGIKVYRLDGAEVKMSDSFRRSAIDLAYYVMFCVGYGISIGRISQSMIDGLPFAKINVLLMENNPFSRISLVFSLVWLLSEYVSMLFNKRKRAIHDYLGGTVVLSEK